MKHPTLALFALCLPATLSAGPGAKANNDEIQQQAKDILAATHVQGGLIVHAGCGDGQLTCALRASDAYTVHGLETDAAQVAEARAYVRSQGLSGRVTVGLWDGTHLPFIDNLVNLLVCNDSADIAENEVNRTLVPNGVAWVRRNGECSKTVKPRRPDIDEWTHYLRDATNNAVAQDSVVGPPRHFQWIGSPQWLRHHDHMSGFSAMVSAKGRLFYIVDLGPRWSEAIPFLGRALVGTAESLVVAGLPGMTDESELYYRYSTPEMQEAMAENTKAFAGHSGSFLMFVSKTDGQRQAAYRLDSAPVFDGMIAANDRLFISTMDGRVICLGGGKGSPLEPALDVKPGPVPGQSSGFTATKSHPDFQFLSTIHVQPSDIGYRLTTAPKQVGWALRETEAPLTKRAVFTLRIRPRPDAPTRDTPGNGFFAFGDSSDDESLVKCGFRISGQRLYINQGPFDKGTSVGTPIAIRAKEVAEMRVAVDLDQQTVAVTMQGETIEAPLARQMDSVRWIGYVISSVPADFSRIEIERE